MKRNSVKKRKSNILKKIIILLILILLIGLGLFFLTNEKENSSQIKKKIVTNKKTPPRVEEKINIVDINSTKRPIAIMIDNNVGNNNHIGLQDAYITYEVSVEGGLTRIMALFKDREIEEIGPVRSSRHYFLDYALESDAIYAHYGWSPYAENDIKNLQVNNINGLTDTNAYWRNKTISAPHNVFTSTEKIYQSAKNYNYKTETSSWQLLNYSAKNLNINELGKENVQKANKIVIKYSNYQTRSYTYDENSKMYFRYMNNNPHTDKKTNEQYKYKNIIIEKVSNKLLDNYGRLDLDTTGVKEGYYISNGYIVPITCIKNSRKEKTIYKYLDQTEIKVNDGNTIIQIMPSNNDIEIIGEE